MWVLYRAAMSKGEIAFWRASRCHSFGWDRDFFFFLEVRVMPCFGFLMKIVSITHGCFHCCGAVHAQRQGLFSSSCCPANKGPGLPSSWEGTADPDWGKGCPIPYSIMDSNKSQGNEGGRDGFSERWRLSSQETITRDEPCFPGSGWTPAWWWEAGNEFLALLHLCTWLLFYLENCLYLSPQVPALFPFQFAPPFHLGSTSEWLGGAELLTGLNHSTRASHLLAAKGSRAVAGFWVGHRPHSFLAQVPAMIAKAEFPDCVSGSWDRRICARSVVPALITGLKNTSPPPKNASAKIRALWHAGCTFCHTASSGKGGRAYRACHPNTTLLKKEEQHHGAASLIAHNASSTDTSRPPSACHEHKCEHKYLIRSTIYNRQLPCTAANNISCYWTHVSSQLLSRNSVPRRRTCQPELFALTLRFLHLVFTSRMILWYWNVIKQGGLTTIYVSLSIQPLISGRFFYYNKYLAFSLLSAL